MNEIPQIDARSTLANWFNVTRNPGNAFWEQRTNWAHQDFLEYLVQCLMADIDAYWKSPPELFSTFASSVIADLPASEQDLENNDTVTVVAFIRYFVSSASLRHAVINGRSSVAYNWLLCSIADRIYEDIQPGNPIEVTFWQGRPLSFLVSRNPVVSRLAPSIVGRWFADLYYSAWKYSLHHNVAKLMLPDARVVISMLFESGELDLVADAIQAASQLGSWLNQTNEPEAKAIAEVLIRVYERPELPAACRKIAGMALATQIGRHTEQGSAAWAARTLKDFRAELIQHEECSLLGHSCATPEELMQRCPALLSAYERFSAELVADYGQDKAGAAFRRAQLFDIIAPSIRELIAIGRCQEAIQLVAAWFGVPVDDRRSSSVLAVVPGHDKGILYAVDNQSKVYVRDTDVALRRMIDAINKGFDTSIAIRHHRESPPATTGRRAPPRRVDELAAAAADFYSVDSLREFLAMVSTPPCGCFHPHAEHTPFQPLTETMLGVTWPIVTSFQEPQADRPLKKVLLWSCGTILGAHEIRSVDAFFTAHGIKCVTVVDKDITGDEFLGYYCDESFDAMWVTSHGEYDSREPHRAHIKLSADGQQSVSVAELIQHSTPDHGRRLLFLNTCLGGCTYGTAAPACLGMGAMLASKNQAVVAHIAEVGTFVAPLFGILVAIGLQQTGAFFSAFRFAIRTLPSDHDAVLDLIRNKAPECAEIVERLSHSSPGVERNDIRTWGTPVFFE